MSVLLVEPPFGSIVSRSMGIPALVAYLRSRGVEATAVDANEALARRFLAPERIDAGFAHAERRIEALNARPRLGFRDLLEFHRLGQCLVLTAGRRDEVRGVLEGPGPEGPEGRERFRLALDVAAAPLFPETLRLDDECTFRYGSPELDEYATGTFDAAARARPWLSETIEGALAPALRSHAGPVVGLSVSHPSQLFPAWIAARLVRRLRPDLRILLGGGFVSCYLRAPPARLLETFDGIVLDDGEAALEAYHREASGAPNGARFDRVPNLVWRDGGGVRTNPLSAPLSLASLPAPDYGRPGLARQLVYRLSRGCWWARCAFCRTDLPMVRHHEQPAAERLFERLREIVGRTDIRAVEFADEAADPEVVEALAARLLDGKLGIVWWVNVRVDARWTPERLRLMRRAGCAALRFGVEAASERLLRLLRKGITLPQAERNLADARAAGVETVAYMMVGLPTETEAEALAGFDRVRGWMDGGLLGRFAYTTFQIVPGSPIHRDPGAFGIRAIAPRPGRDVAFPMYDFEGEGMPRCVAYRLERRFNDVAESRGRSDGPPEVREIPLAGRSIPLRFDPLRIRDAVESAAIEDATYGEWLETAGTSVPSVEAG